VPPSDVLHRDVVDCRGLVQVYRVATGEVHALRGVDAAFTTGTLSAVVGPSGSGKSTLLRAIALMERPTAGTLTICGVDAVAAGPRTVRRLRRRSIAVVTQRPTHNLYPHLDALEHVQTALVRRTGTRRGALEALESVGLAHRRDARPRQLSGGEQQRLAVVMATVGGTELILADEPTAELDTESAATVIDLLRAAATAGAAVVVNTHDRAVAESADRVLALHHGTMHSEQVHGSATVGVIDAVGRIQLPPELLDGFPGRRAAISVGEDGAVVLRPIATGADHV